MPLDLSSPSDFASSEPYFSSGREPEFLLEQKARMLFTALLRFAVRGSSPVCAHTGCALVEGCAFPKSIYKPCHPVTATGVLLRHYSPAPAPLPYTRMHTHTHRLHSQGCRRFQHGSRRGLLVKACESVLHHVSEGFRQDVS